MSRENVEVVLGQFSDLNSRDFAAVTDAWSDSAVLVLHGDLLSIGGAGSEGGAIGKEAIVRWFSDWFTTFGRDYRFEMHETRDLGDRVLVDATHHAAGRASRVPITNRTAWVFTIYGGKIERCDCYSSRSEALEAVGLSE